MLYPDKIYGTHPIEGVLEALIRTATFQRLQRIHQGGAVFLLHPQMNQTRFEHSIGVMLLIRQLGGSLEEQIAGLLHDISHTAFSHVIDYVLKNQKEDYHEDRYPLVMRSPDITAVLHQFGYQVDQFLTIEPFKLLEHPLPGLCADRIDYTLRDLYQYGEISLDEIQCFLDSLMVMDQQIVLNSKAQGTWFRDRYQLLVSKYFVGKQYQALHEVVTVLFRQYIDTEVLKLEDFHQDDWYVLDQIAMHTGQAFHTTLSRALAVEHPLPPIQHKQRSVDPLIYTGTDYRPLSKL